MIFLSLIVAEQYGVLHHQSNTSIYSTIAKPHETYVHFLITSKVMLWCSLQTQENTKGLTNQIATINPILSVLRQSV